MEEVPTKVCKCCGKELPLTEYYKNSATKDGHDNKCKKCRNKQIAEYEAKHKKKKNNMEEETLRVCSTCHKKLPLSEFYKNRCRPGGHEYVCKSCKNEWHKEYQAKRKARQNAEEEAAHPDVLPFVVETPLLTLNLADITDKELFEEIRRRGYTGDLRFSKVITI